MPGATAHGGTEAHMATYFLRSTHICRSRGARVTRAAAYRAGEKIRDQRSGETYNHSDRDDVAYKEVVLAEDLAGRPDMAWTQNRSTLWNAAEHAGRRCNSRLARELLVLLPPELSEEQRTNLARSFAQHLANQYRCAIDVCVHEPRPGADDRNHHAHLLMTTREVSPEGFGRRITLEIMMGPERYERGAGPARQEYMQLRERWATLTNEALRQGGLDVRVSHRSYAAQGLDREAGVNLPDKVFYAERKLGHSTPAGDAIRARHRERVEARAKGPAELARVLARQRQEAAQEIANRQPKPPRRELTRDERNAKRREYYRQQSEKIRQDPQALEQRRAAGRRAWRVQWERNPKQILEQQRRWKAANRDRVNRNQRAYKQLNAEKLNARRRELRAQARAREAEPPGRGPRIEQSQPTKAESVPAVPSPPVPVPVVEDPVQAWLAQRMQQSATSEADDVNAWFEHRSRQGPEPSEQDYVQAWLEHRARQGPEPTEEDHVNAWLEHRQQSEAAGQDARTEDTPTAPGRDRGHGAER